MNNNLSIDARVQNASGAIDYTLTNDYMFRALLQENLTVTKALVAALLHLNAEDISELTVLNPIELGASIADKDFILDLRLLLGGGQVLDLEMQRINEYNWTERSICYTFRSLDTLKRGEDYKDLKPVINIGFLDYTLFRDAPEFYSRNLLMNVKTHRIYSDKIDIRVVDLTCIHLATGEDKAYRIDYWAKLFKAATWEEIRMIAKNDTYMNEATKTLYELNSDELIRQQCQARADFEYWERVKQHKIETLTAENEALASEKAMLTSERAMLVSEKAMLVSEVDTLKKLLAEHGIEIPAEN